MSSEVEVKPISPTGDGDYVHDSEEYESAEEIEGDEYDEEEEIEEIEVEVEEGDEDEECEKDPEAKDKSLDDDEDRKNPQFIPKKGYFYEHDDRMHGEEGEKEEPPVPKADEKPKKEGKVITDRWSHDLFDENDQAPKSHSELEERYGYDIRGDDMAPRARRKRLYGRGPTKYTRKWEEEEAYQRPRGGFRGRRAASRGRDFQPTQTGSKGYDEEFPQLSDDKNISEEKSEKGIQRPLQNTSKSDRGRSSGGNRGTGGNNRQRKSDWDTSERERDEENEERDRNFSRGGGFNRGGRGRGGRRNEFSNRNRYPDRRGSNTTGSAEANNNMNKNQQKTREERDWEQQVDRIREQEKKQTNGTGVNASNNTKASDYPSASSAKPSGSFGNKPQSSAKKSTLPFTNTEYTGSASLTANRSKEQVRANNFESGESTQMERENISVKLVNAGPNQGGREVRITEKDDPSRPQGTTQNYGNRSQIPPRLTRFQQQPQQPTETVKPKRFSSQRPKSEAPTHITGNTAPVSPSPPLGHVQTGSTSSPQPQMVPTTVPPSVITGYAPQHSQQAYYEQAVQMPTNYEPQAYEASGSPITVPITAHVSSVSVSPSLWGPQHPAYSTSPYPSPPTGQVPQQPFDPSAYIPPQPQIFAPPPHPHPQFIQDPTIINYVPPGPPPSFGAPFHSQGYQGYPQVAPGPPELYHGGVTYYSTQNQIQRPHIMVPTKRPKSVLQLVEPPKQTMRQGPRPNFPSQEEALLMSEMYLHHQYREDSLPHIVDYRSIGTTGLHHDPNVASSTTEQLTQKFDELVTLQPHVERVKKSPSPAPLDLTETASWADQMADLTPLNSPSEQQPPKNQQFGRDKSSTPNTTELGKSE